MGAGFVKLLHQHRELLAANGLELNVTRIAVRNVERKRDLPAGAPKPVAHSLAVVESPDVDLVVETMGGVDEAYRLIRRALELGKPVVTANKAVLAEKLPELIELAKKADKPIGFEAAVAAFIPVIETLDTSLACEDIAGVRGVVNGTTNYILTFMEREGASFEQALADATAKGFTEADPSLDVDGIDAAQKICLLAYKTFGAKTRPREIHVEGISQITHEDIELAGRMGHRVKLVAAAQKLDGGLSVRVHPALILKGELLAECDSEFNAIILEGPGFKELSFLGKGAGQFPTASAVLNDVVKIARGHCSGLPGFVKTGGTLKSLPIADMRFGYYLRARVASAAAAQRIAGALGERGVTILNQASLKIADASYAAFITDTALELDMMKSLDALAKIEGVKERPAFIRLDKDSYRDIVEAEQRQFIGTGLKR